jgi:hypothetical protein
MSCSQDQIPETFSDRTQLERVHVDVGSKHEIWTECCHELEQERLASGLTIVGEAVSQSYFMKVLRGKYNVVIHRHKRFTQCALCYTFKIMLKAAKNTADRTNLRWHRKQHHDIVRCHPPLSLVCGCAKSNPTRQDGTSSVPSKQSKGPTKPQQCSKHHH